LNLVQLGYTSVVSLSEAKCRVVTYGPNRTVGHRWWLQSGLINSRSRHRKCALGPH